MTVSSTVMPTRSNRRLAIFSCSEFLVSALIHHTDLARHVTATFVETSNWE